VVYPIAKEHALIHSPMIGFAGETVSPIEVPYTGKNFIGNVYEYNCGNGLFYPYFTSGLTYPRAEHIQFLKSQGQDALIPFLP
jgi:hypothetical protein